MSSIENIKLVDLIRRIAGKNDEDSIKIFTGIVLDNSDAFTKGTITVQEITGKVYTDLEPYTQDYNPNADNYNSGVTERTPMIHDDVELQPLPGDYNFVIPSINSYVRVCYSKYNAPFVMQMEDVDSIHNATRDGVVIISMDKDQYSITASQSIISLNNTSNSLSVGSNTNYTLITQQNNQIDFKVNNGIEVLLDTKFDAKTPSGAELTLDTLITIKNNTTSLLEILQDFITNLNSGSNSGGAIVFATDPAFTLLLTKISALLGS